MEKKQNDRKELRTSFDMVTFATAIETLRKGEETIASLAERYEEGDKRRDTLNRTEQHLCKLLRQVSGGNRQRLCRVRYKRNKTKITDDGQQLRQL